MTKNEAFNLTKWLVDDDNDNDAMLLMMMTMRMWIPHLMRLMEE